VSNFPIEEDREDQVGLEKEIEVDGAPLDLPYQEEVRYREHESALERLNHRITLLAILLPCLFGVLLLYAYLDMKEYVNRVQDAGSTQVKSLSEDVVEKVSSLSDQQSELMKSLSNRIGALEASAVITKENEKNQSLEIKNIEASKVDKKVLDQIQNEIAEATKTLKGLQDELNKQQGSVNNLNQALKKDMAGLVKAVEGIRGDRAKQDSAMKSLSERKMDKEVFDQFLKQDRAGYESAIAPLKQGMSQLQKQIDMLGRSIQLLETERTSPDKKPSQKTATDNLPSAPGTIIEQEIRK